MILGSQFSLDQFSHIINYFGFDDIQVQGFPFFTAYVKVHELEGCAFAVPPEHVHTDDVFIFQAFIALRIDDGAGNGLGLDAKVALQHQMNRLHHPDRLAFGFFPHHLAHRLAVLGSAN